jgi:FkbH-like protein
MIETLPARPALAALPVPAEVLAGFTGFQRQLAGVGQLVWGEHCSECDYPQCYETCAFYTPRADLHCRRFEAGIERVKAGSEGGPLHRIRFRQWGKLEARGAAAITPIAAARRQDRNDDRVAAAMGALPLPFSVKRNTAWRWNQRKEAAAARGSALAADAFVVEAWAADGWRHGLTLTLLNTDENNGRLFQRRFEAGPSYQRLTVPVAEIAAQVDLDAPFLVQIEPVGDAAGRDVVFGVCDFVTLKQAAAPAAAPAPVKVVVWDLDETLWTGTLAEDGAQGVRVRPDAEAAVRALDERGVLQSIASKNDHGEALAALTAMGLADIFLHPQVNWNPKSQSVANIAAALDLGLDSFVFIDDQPFERAEVVAAHPAVRAWAHTEVAGLLARAEFDLPVTPESRQRRGMYRAEAARAQAFQSTGDDYLRFLRDSGLRITVRPLDAADVERVYELSQRTNQLNFCGAKFTRDAVQALAAPGPEQRALSVRCADRFGDYGLIGFVSLNLRRGEITDLFMSCRVQRKRVEHALMAWIAAEIAPMHPRLGVRYRPSARNGAALAMLRDLGFTAGAADGEDQVWTHPTAQPFADADIVRLRADEMAHAA